MAMPAMPSSHRWLRCFVVALASFGVPCCLSARRSLSPFPAVLDWGVGRGGTEVPVLMEQ